jgi:hypothetical protein
MSTNKMLFSTSEIGLAGSLSGVQRAFYAEAGFLHDVGVELGGGDVFVAEEFLDGADIGARFEKVCGKTVAESMGTGAFADFGGADSGGDGALEAGFVDVMTAGGAGARVGGEFGGWEDPKPGPLERGGWIFCGQSVWKPYSRQGVSAVGIVPFAGGMELGFEGGEEGFGKHGDAVFIPFAIANDDDALAEIDVLDAQAECFEKAEAGAVEEAGKEVMNAGEVAKDAVDFVAGQDLGDALWPPGTLEIPDPGEVLEKDFLVEEEQGVKGLVLGGGGDVAVVGEMGEESADFGFAHFPGMTFAAPKDKATDPVAVGFLGANGEMEEASDFAALVKEAKFRVWDEEVVRMSRAIKHSDARLQHKCWIGQESSCYTSAGRATLRVNSVE